MLEGHMSTGVLELETSQSNSSYLVKNKDMFHESTLNYFSQPVLQPVHSYSATQ